MYDHGARNRNPISTLWYGIDPQFEKYPDFSPYNYCAGNPVRLVDLDGREFTDALKSKVDELRTMIGEKIQSYNNKLHEGCSDSKKGLYINRINDLKNALDEFDVLESSSQLYDYKALPVPFSDYSKQSEKREGETTAVLIMSENKVKGSVVFIGVYEGYSETYELLVHELKHAFQFETGKLSLSINEGGSKYLYDYTDEQQAYDRQSSFAGQVRTPGKYYDSLKSKGDRNLLKTKNSQLIRASQMDIFTNQIFRKDGKTYYNGSVLNVND